MNNQPPAPTRARTELDPLERSRRAAMEPGNAQLRALGIQRATLLKKLDAMTEATRTHVLLRKGKIERVQVEDNPARLKALDMLLTLDNAYPAKQIDIGGTVRVEQLHLWAEQLAHLPPDQLLALARESDDVIEAEPAPEDAP